MMAKSKRRRDEERRRAAAAKVAEMREAQLAAERRRRSLTVSAVAVAVIVIAVGVFVFVQTRSSAPTVSASVVHGSTGGYGFVVGKADAPASLVVYEDFQCPICQHFEQIDDAMMAKKVTAGTLKVEYRPIAILDRESSTDYSSRASNASACVRNATDATTWKAFHDLLYKNQPAEGSAGLSDDQLTTYATQAGAKAPSVGTCISDERYKNWVSSATEASSKAGVSGTPTVLLNGQDVSLDDLNNVTTFEKLIDNAADKG
jgi:protein-disulfide isomerase